MDKARVGCKGVDKASGVDMARVECKGWTRLGWNVKGWTRLGWNIKE